MLGLKQTIDTHFNDNWTYTPIQFYGTNFDNNADNFIMLSTSPLSSDILSVDNICRREEMLIEVFCYNRVLNDAMNISDKVIDLLRLDTDFVVKNNITSETITLDANMYMSKVIATAYSNSVVPTVLPLVDGAGLFLVDSSSNQLVG